MDDPRRAPRPRLRAATKLLGLVFGLGAFLTAVYLVAESYGFTQERRMAVAIEGFAARGGGRTAVGLVVIGLLVADLALPVPSSLVMTLAGRFLGTGAGFVCNLAGSMGASLLGYALCRTFGRGSFARLFGAEDAGPAENLFAAFGPWAIALSRPVPMFTEIVSCLAGLAGMPFRPFVLLTLLGTVPVSFAYAWLGARARDALGFQWPLLIAFVLPGAGLLAVWLLGRRTARSPASREGPGTLR